MSVVHIYHDVFAFAGRIDSWKHGFLGLSSGIPIALLNPHYLICSRQRHSTLLIYAARQIIILIVLEKANVAGKIVNWDL